MKIACLQFAPKLGDVQNNIGHADAILERADVKNLDLLVLPELAFTGYKFKSLQHITPYLEDVTKGITASWARSKAEKYDCFVVVGYPEAVDVRDHWPTDPKYYNSAMMVNPAGDTIVNYRKTHLYYLDETWALEGPEGFYSGNIPWLGDIAMGIYPLAVKGADDNRKLTLCGSPYKFEAPRSAWEFAFHVLHNEAKLVIISMSWMTAQHVNEYAAETEQPDLDTLAYWLSRLEPLIRQEPKGEIIVVIASRCGVEDGIVYAGTSCILGIQEGEVKVYGMLGRGDSELLIVDTEGPERFKLVTVKNSDISEDAFQSRGARELLSSNDPAKKGKDAKVEKAAEPQFSSTARALTRGIPSIDAILSDRPLFPPVNTLSQHRFFSSATPPSQDRRGKGKSQRQGEGQNSSTPSTSLLASAESKLSSLKLDTNARPDTPTVGDTTWDKRVNYLLPIVSSSEEAPTSPWRSEYPDDIPDSASSMTVNTPWDNHRAKFRAEDVTKAIRARTGSPEYHAPQEATPTLSPIVFEPRIASAAPYIPLVGSQSTVPSGFPVIPVEPTERPRSPKSRNTSRSRTENREPMIVLGDRIGELEVPMTPIRETFPGESPVAHTTDTPIQPPHEGSADPVEDRSTSPRPHSTIW